MTITPCPTCGSEPIVTLWPERTVIECVARDCPDRPLVAFSGTTGAVDLWNSQGWYSGNKTKEE